MLEIQHILCPVDFSLGSKRALDHAVVLAGWYGSRITALHLSNSPFLPQPPVLFAEPSHTATGETAGDTLEAELAGWVAPARAAGIRVDVVLETSHNAAAGILQHAETLPADFIVLGTHGRGGFERLMIGSVAEKVLRKASVPVMTVPPPATHPSSLPFKRILCPVDFSEPSVSAVRYASSLAGESDAALTLLHVIEWPSDDETVVDRAIDVPEYRRKMEAETHARLANVMPAQARPWCESITRVMWGKSYRGILQAAEDETSDLIVMGVHGRNALELMLFGSTTNQTVRRAPCPVLTLRPAR